MDMIFTIGIFTSLFFSVLLFSKKNKSLPDKVLAFWMLIIGIHLISTYINVQGYWKVYPHLIGITAPLPLMYGPMLYLYISHSIKDERRLSRLDYFHFTPVTFSYLYMFRFYFFYTAEEKRKVDEGLVDDFGLFSTILVLVIVLSALCYAIYSFRLLKKHKDLVENNFSNTEGIHLDWLKSFIWGMALIFFSITIILIIKDIDGVTFSFNPDFIFYSMIVFAILGLGYFGIKHQDIFTDNVIIDVGALPKSSYERSSLRDDKAVEVHQSLLKLMDEDKPYLQSNVTLNTIAEKLGVSLHHLSQIINQNEGQNFNDFVNKYRVEEFIHRASENKHFSYLAHAFDSGFNSKSTFNSVFKKHKGITPSQYMSEHKKMKED